MMPCSPPEHLWIHTTLVHPTILNGSSMKPKAITEMTGKLNSKFIGTCAIQLGNHWNCARIQVANVLRRGGRKWSIIQWIDNEERRLIRCDENCQMCWGWQIQSSNNSEELGTDKWVADEVQVELSVLTSNHACLVSQTNQNPSLTQTSDAPSPFWGFVRSCWIVVWSSLM